MKRGITVITPDMPNTNVPTIETWVPFLSNLVKDPYKDFYFVGHSIGCLTILQYLSALPEWKVVGGVVFVAGWTTLTNQNDKEKEIAKPWIETQIDWVNVASHSKAFVAIYSDDDPYVPVSNAQFFQEKLGAKLVLDSRRGHFTDEDDVTQLPIVLKELLIMMNIPMNEPVI